jgi:ElaB/YqjD/DUF883 family membrane-anchored ribosome-binding protein
MTTEKNNNLYKIIAGILTVLLVGLGVFTTKLYNDNKETVSVLETQKADIQGELKALLKDYDEVIQDNEIKDTELMEARDRIKRLLDSVQDAKANVALIRRYKQEISRLKQERLLLFRKADSLIAANQNLAMQRDSTLTILDQTVKVVDSVATQNIALAEAVKRGSVVNALDLSAAGVIVRKSGKIIDTKRAHRADKIRACFTLAPNPLAEKGDRVLYIQVINPKNNLLGSKKTLEFEEGTLNYSVATKVFYENEELDVCAMVDANETDLIKGTYRINVFDGARQVATTTLELN